MKSRPFEKAVGSFLEGEGFRRAAREGVWLRNVGEQLDEVVLQRRRFGTRIAVRLRLKDAKTMAVITDASDKALRGLDYVLDEALEGIAPAFPKEGWISADPEAAAKIVAALRDEGLPFLKAMHSLVGLRSHLERRVHEGGGLHLRLHWAVTLARLGQTQRALDALSEAKGLSASEKKTIDNLRAWALAQSRIERPPKRLTFPKAVGAVLEAAGFHRTNPGNALEPAWSRRLGDYQDEIQLQVSPDLLEISFHAWSRDDVTGAVVDQWDPPDDGKGSFYPISLHSHIVEPDGSNSDHVTRADPDGPSMFAELALHKALPFLDSVHSLESVRDYILAQIRPESHWKARMSLAVTLCRQGDKQGALDVMEEPINGGAKNRSLPAVIEIMRRWVREYEVGD